jgi:hypothetical protein
MSTFKKALWNDSQLIEVEDLEVDQFYHNRKIEKGIKDLHGNGIIPTSISTFDNMATDTGNLAIQEDLTMEKQVTGTSISDVGYRLDDVTINSFQNVVVQKFMAATDNIFEVDIYVKRDDDWTTGDLNVEIRELADGTNVDSNAKDEALGRVRISRAQVSTSYGWVTASFRNQTGVSNPGSLTVGNFYAIAIERDQVVDNGNITVGYTETTTDNTTGYLARYTYSTSTWVNTIDTTIQYLIYRIRTNALRIRAGIAYLEGQKIELTQDVENLSLVDMSTTGKTDYNIVTLSADSTTSTTQYNDRMKAYVVTRTQPTYAITLFNETDWATEQNRCRFYCSGDCIENNVCEANNWQVTGKCINGTYASGESYGPKYLQVATAKNNGSATTSSSDTHELENGITITDERPIIPIAYTDESDTSNNDANYVIKGTVGGASRLYKIDVNATGTAVIATAISS